MIGYCWQKSCFFHHVSVSWWQKFLRQKCKTQRFYSSSGVFLFLTERNKDPKDLIDNELTKLDSIRHIQFYSTNKQLNKLPNRYPRTSVYWYIGILVHRYIGTSVHRVSASDEIGTSVYYIFTTFPAFNRTPPSSAVQKYKPAGKLLISILL